LFFVDAMFGDAAGQVHDLHRSRSDPGGSGRIRKSNDAIGVTDTFVAPAQPAAARTASHTVPHTRRPHPYRVIGVYNLQAMLNRSVRGRPAELTLLILRMRQMRLNRGARLHGPRLHVRIAARL